VRLFDSHCHIQNRAFDADRSAVLARARVAGVVEMVVVGEDEGSSRVAVDLSAADPDLWAAVGLHPHEARRADEGWFATLGQLARAPKVVAVGEIGLDYHYDRSPREIQRAVFRRQLEVASACDLPVVIHSRAAETDTSEILAAWVRERGRGDGAPLGVMHCFGYDVAAMERFVALGFMISIPGTVTFAKADEVRAVAGVTPDDALLVETDAPVLAPQPHRGRRNEPGYLVETAKTVAALRGVSLARLAELTSANAHRLFRLPAGSRAAGGAEGVPA